MSLRRFLVLCVGVIGLSAASTGNAAMWGRHRIPVRFEQANATNDVQVYGIRVTEKGDGASKLQGNVRLTNPSMSQKLGTVTYRITAPDGTVLKEGTLALKPQLLNKSGQASFNANLDVVPPRDSVVQVMYNPPVSEP
jgi:hypothetical protein